jgi:serine/threonine protein kinase
MQIEEIPEKFEINGKTYINAYKKFGSSAFGDIFQVRADDEKQDYILKRSKKYLQQDRSDKSFKMLQTEYDLLSIIAGCPHIIRVKEFSKDANPAMMLLEYAKGGELFDYINDKIRSKEKIDMKTFENLFKQLILAVKCFHLLGVYNRDITTTNILFLDPEKTTLAIIDFGLGIKSAGDKCIGLKGSGRFIAPEVNVDDGKEYKCSKADIFFSWNSIVRTIIN